MYQACNDLVTPKAGAKSELLSSGSLNKMVILTHSFKCDQMYTYGGFNYGHTLLCCLSKTYMFNKPTSEARGGLLYIYV
jgi:hypothetical protein